MFNNNEDGKCIERRTKHGTKNDISRRKDMEEHY